MGEWSYDMPWRKNYEAYQITGWATGLALSTSAYFFYNLPTLPYMVTVGLQVSLMLKAVPKALYVRNSKKGLEAKPPIKIDSSDLMKLMSKNPLDTYLGEGFEWTQTEGQQIFELLKRDISKLVPPPPPGYMGKAFIHGIGRLKEESQFIRNELRALHTLVIGTTGSGKTRTFDLLISQCIFRGEPVVIIDPKGDKDLPKLARLACETVGRPEAFKYFNPAFPEKSVRISPTKNYGRATELATRIAELISTESASDPFQNFGLMSLINSVQLMLFCDQQPTLVSLRSALESGTARLVIDAVRIIGHEVLGEHVYEAIYLQEVSRLKGRQKEDQDEYAKICCSIYYRDIKPEKSFPDMEGGLTMFQHNKEHFSKMITALLPVLVKLTAGHLGPLLSPQSESEFNAEVEVCDTRTIVASNQVLFMGLDSLSDSMVGSAIGSIFLSDITSVAGNIYNYHEPKPVNIFVDEAAEVVNDQLIQLLNKGRGAGFNLIVATQTIEDFEARLGSAAKAGKILGNMNHVIVLRSNTPDTQEQIFKKVPKTRFRYVMRTQSGNAGMTPHEVKGSIGERLMEEEAELFPAALAGELPNLEYFGIISGGRLVKGKIPLINYNDNSESREKAHAALKKSIKKAAAT